VAEPSKHSKQALSKCSLVLNCITQLTTALSRIVIISALSSNVSVLDIRNQFDHSCLLFIGTSVLLHS
jgi:hypothetical protein